jgi:transcriptional regulator with XRE-family HTH domain
MQSIQPIQPKRTMHNGATFEAFLIGDQIRHVRRSKDVSQAILAKQTGVSVGWISRIERGLDMPNLPLLIKMAKALQVSVRELIPRQLPP